MATIRILPQTEVTDEHVQRAVALFKDSFGKWESGERIEYDAARLRAECLFDVDKCFMVEAVETKKGAEEAPLDDDAELLGYCFCTKWGLGPTSQHQPAADGSACSLSISLLVVRPEYRCQGLATSLLQACWNDTLCVLMRLVTSHPHAVLALERATQRLATHQVLAPLDFAMKKEFWKDYLTDPEAPLALLENKVMVFTQFHAYRSEVDELRRSIKDWRFRSLERGQEYVATASREGPIIVALRPGKQADRPGKEPDQPGKESDHASKEPAQPGKESDQRGKESDQPGTASDQPRSASDQPGKESDQPGTASDQPGSASDQPNDSRIRQAESRIRQAKSWIIQLESWISQAYDQIREAQRRLSQDEGSISQEESRIRQAESQISLAQRLISHAESRISLETSRFSAGALL